MQRWPKIARVWDGRADQPDSASNTTRFIEVEFGAANVGFEIVVELVGGLDDRGSIQAGAVFADQAAEDSLTQHRGVGADSLVGEVKIRDDPRA